MSPRPTPDASDPHPVPPGYTIQTLSPVTAPEDLGEVPGLHLPSSDSRLSRPPAGSWHSALALGEEGAVGMVVVELPAGVDEETAGHVISLVVKPDHRNQGLGTALLSTAEQMAREAGAVEVVGAYRTSWEDRDAIERMLDSRGWSEPETRLILARSETEQARRLIEENSPTLPDEAKIVPLTHLSPDELESVLAGPGTDREALGQIPESFEGPRLERKVSVALRWKERLAGWMVCHRLAEDTLQYSSFYVRPDLRRRGLGWALVREAVSRHLADPTLGQAVLAVDARNTQVRQLIEHHVQDYVVAISELRVSRRAL